MRAVLSRRSPRTMLAALALALVASMVISATVAQAQPGPKRAYCHSTGSATNPYVLVVVQAGGPADVAHESHTAGGSQERTPPDIFLGEGLSRDEARELFAEQCAGGDTTTTTGTGTTTTGTGTTTTGTDTTTTTGTDTTTTTGTDTTTTTGTDTTTTTTGKGTTTTTTGDGTTTTTGKGITTTTTGKVIITPPDDAKKVGFTKFEGVKKTVFFDAEKNVFFIIVDKEVVVVEKDVIVLTEDVPAAVQYQYASPSASASAPAEEAMLPETGGSGLLPAIGAMVLLLGGGLTALLAVKRGTIGG